MNSAALTMGLSKLAIMIADSYKVSRLSEWSQRRFGITNKLVLRDSPSASSPLSKWKNEIRKFHYQAKEAHLPYFIRTNPWLKELRFSLDDNVEEKGNFLTVNKTLYELCRHNAVFH